MRRSLVAVTAVSIAVVLGASACGSSDPLSGGNSAAGTIVVGSADFAESELLAEIYAEALRTTGATVETKPRIGAREIYVESVRKGELTLIPDYTGNLLYYLDKSATATTPEQVNSALQGAAAGNLQTLTPSPAEDADVLTVTKATAAAGITSMADLGPRCGELVLGAAAEWKTRWEQKIKELYGCTFKEIRSLESGSVTVKALTSGQVQVANLFTTASAIKENDLVELDDPKQMYPAQNVVPLVGKGKLTDQQIALINRVSAALTTEQLTELVRKVEVDKANAVDVAKSFVQPLNLGG
jgi:osmoprotectant transport system substrate-binding protein